MRWSTAQATFHVQGLARGKEKARSPHAAAPRRWQQIVNPTMPKFQEPPIK